jgi:hypothetical protein
MTRPVAGARLSINGPSRQGQSRIGPARTGPAIVLIAAALAGFGCSQGPQPAQPQGLAVRAAVETAPADLQLMCAAEAAKVYSAPSDKVLPLSSQRSGATAFEVELDVAGKRARCTIDESGAPITVVDA